MTPMERERLAAYRLIHSGSPGTWWSVLSVEQSNQDGRQCIRHRHHRIMAARELVIVPALISCTRRFRPESILPAEDVAPRQALRCLSGEMDGIGAGRKGHRREAGLHPRHVVGIRNPEILRGERGSQPPFAPCL